MLGTYSVTKANAVLKTLIPYHAFQRHMENLLNPNIDPCVLIDVRDQVSIPLLDGPFTFQELQNVVNMQIKPNKGCVTRYVEITSGKLAVVPAVVTKYYLPIRILPYCLVFL